MKDKLPAPSAGLLFSSHQPTASANDSCAATAQQTLVELKDVTSTRQLDALPEESIKDFSIKQADE